MLTKRHYPDTLLSDLFDPLLTIDKAEAAEKGEIWLAAQRKKQVQAGKVDRSDAALADLLLSLIKQPNQDIVRQCYKDGMTLAAIGKERGISKSRVGQQKDKGLRLIRHKWSSHDCPASVDEYYAVIKKREAAITLKSGIGTLPVSARLLNALSHCNVNTVGELLDIPDGMYLRNVGPKGWDEIRRLQAKAREIIENNSKKR